MPYTPENLRALAWVRNGSKPSAPVDVLAVMDALETVSGIPGDQLQKLADVRQARAAIAELIEAAREASGTLGHIYHTTPLHPELEQYAHDGYQRLDAALARVGGAL